MQFFARRDGVKLAYEHLRGTTPTVVFLPGFGGTMTGDKASHLKARCAASGRAFLSLDYSGHGASEGAFEDGTVGLWRDDALAVIDRTTRGQMILVGSSMGGWIAMLIALLRPARVVGLVGIAAAPDFTERRIWGRISAEQKQDILRRGHILVPSSYSDGLHVSRALIEDGRRNALLHGPIPIRCPVRLLQGVRDPEVDWGCASEISGLLESEDVRVTLIKDGDHNLSRASDLIVLEGVVDGLLGQNGA